MIDAIDIAKKVEVDLREVFGGSIVKVMLYGSYASGTQGADSDVDIIVLVSDDEKIIESKRARILDVAADMSSLYNVFVSVMVRNDRSFYERSKYVPFYMNVARHGIAVHG
jgi:uncharacterized protein